MARYYDMDKLKEMISAKAETLLTGKQAFFYIAKWLDRLPAADVVEIKHGKWRLEECQCGLFSTTQFFVCSACNEEFFVEGWDYEDLCANVKYCPNCGARMG